MEAQNRVCHTRAFIDIVKAPRGNRQSTTLEWEEFAPGWGLNDPAAYQVTLIMVTLSPEPIPISAT